MRQVSMMILKVVKANFNRHSLSQWFFFRLGGSTAGSSAILSSDNLDEKLDAAIEDLRSKE